MLRPPTAAEIVAAVTYAANHATDPFVDPTVATVRQRTDPGWARDVLARADGTMLLLWDPAWTTFVSEYATLLLLTHARMLVLDGPAPPSRSP